MALVLIVIAAGMFLGGDSGLGLTGDEDPVATPVATAATGDASPQPTSDAGATVVPDAPEGTVPDFVGVARSTVLEYLAAEGVRAPLVLENADETVPAGQVIRQSPQAGAELTADTIVTLFVSTGPPEDVGSE